MEKIPTNVFDTAPEGAKYVADKIKDTIIKNDAKGKMTVLGLATGATPILLYKELIKMHQDGLSFSNVVSFNLDEYYPMPADAIQSYNRFMDENLFDHIDIKKENVFIPDGTVSLEEIEKYCENYEKKIEEFGGVDIQILGIGRTGHIGFNEPGSSPKSLTRLVTLDKKTRIDASGDFRNEGTVPRTAITMGVGTISKAKRIFLMAWGDKKASIVAKAVEGEDSWQVPATYLQNHPETSFVIDASASIGLQRIKTPWLNESCDWDWKLSLKAVIWLCDTINKPVLKLTDEDYNKNGMGDLIAKSGNAYDLNLQVFRHLRDTITGWPGGKPGTKDEKRPERAEPFPKKSLIFSPHPDDEVVSMGGTLIRLVDQGHDVHVAYQTSGNLGVVDDAVINQLNFVKEFAAHFNISDGETEKHLEKTKAVFMKKVGPQEDLDNVKQIKSLVRKIEAKASCRYCGVPSQNVHFLNLPFYETEGKTKNELCEEDIQITVDILQKIQPHQVFLSGDQIDPNSAYKICFDVVIEAFKRLSGESWVSDCWLWMYRGTNFEWPVSEIDMAVPLSPEEMIRKRQAIVKHKSQMTVPVFAGDVTNDSWQRAENKNKKTAGWYDRLGLPEYEGVEVFKKYSLK
ncbi:MAG: glucosamine-6-phosphate deaminase [Glaciecola sp.]